MSFSNADRRFEIRCTAEELEAWREAAAEEGLPLATWVKKVINSYLVGQWAPKMQVIRYVEEEEGGETNG